MDLTARHGGRAAALVVTVSLILTVAACRSSEVSNAPTTSTVAPLTQPAVTTAASDDGSPVVLACPAANPPASDVGPRPTGGAPSLGASITLSGAVTGTCAFDDRTPMSAATSCTAFAQAGTGDGTLRVPSIAYSGSPPSGGVTYGIRVAEYHGAASYAKETLFPQSEGKRPTIWVTRGTKLVPFSPAASSTASATIAPDGSGAFSFTGFADSSGVSLAGKVTWTCNAPG